LKRAGPNKKKPAGGKETNKKKKPADKLRRDIVLG